MTANFEADMPGDPPVSETNFEIRYSSQLLQVETRGRLILFVSQPLIVFLPLIPLNVTKT